MMAEKIDTTSFFRILARSMPMKEGCPPPKTFTNAPRPPPSSPLYFNPPPPRTLLLTTTQVEIKIISSIDYILSLSNKHAHIRYRIT